MRYSVLRNSDWPDFHHQASCILSSFPLLFLPFPLHSRLAHLRSSRSFLCCCASSSVVWLSVLLRRASLLQSFSTQPGSSFFLVIHLILDYTPPATSVKVVSILSFLQHSKTRVTLGNADYQIIPALLFCTNRETEKKSIKNQRLA